MPDSLRELLEQREQDTLSPHAARASESRGRQRPQQEHPHRTAFQRDRDRILHAKAFRRLIRKTQVFLAPAGDHYRTRLTHTLEVAQIARTVSRALFLNEDLTEAIALGHDLGHAPFGHAGESVLNDVYAGGFNHADHGLRIIDKLESTRHGPGLNLTFEVRDGIVGHSKGKTILWGEPCDSLATLEAAVVCVCDAVAYINHDIDDAVRSGLITIDDLPKDAIDLLGKTSSERINKMVGALIQGSADDRIAMEEDVSAAANELRSHMYDCIYPCDAIRGEIDKGKKIVRDIYYYLVEHARENDLGGDPADTIERRAVDHVAGMTDQYALQYYERLFFPSSWPA